MAPFRSSLTRSQGCQSMTSCKMCSREQKGLGAVFSTDLQSFSTFAHMIRIVWTVMTLILSKCTTVGSIAAAVRVTLDGVGEARWDESHWLRLETWSWHLHTLEPADAREKKQNTHICFFHAHFSWSNVVEVRDLGDKVAGSRGNHRFFNFIDYQQAEWQLKTGRNVPRWHSYASCESDSFILYKTNVHCGISRQGKETLNTSSCFPATPVLQWGIISKSLPLQGKYFMHLPVLIFLFSGNTDVWKRGAHFIQFAVLLLWQSFTYLFCYFSCKFSGYPVSKFTELNVSLTARK